MSKKEGIDVHNIDEVVDEWEGNIEELSRKEIEYAKLKEEYDCLSEKIIRETDFKALYDKNNKDVRKMHVKKILSSKDEKIQSLGFDIDYLKRRNSFLKAMTYVNINCIGE